MNLADLTRLRWSIAFLLLLALIGSCAVLGTVRFTNERQKEHRQAQGERAKSQDRLAQLGFDGQLIEKRLARYRELMSHGYIGEEKRMEWVEEMSRIGRKRHLLGFSYELTPQQPLDNARGDGYEALSSHMKLQMQLLHEEDLFNFLADLGNRVPAYIRINSCRIERLPRSTNKGGLQTDCSIDWITFREKQ